MQSRTNPRDGTGTDAMSLHSPLHRLTVSNPGPRNTSLTEPATPEKELYLYARSFHAAAKKLAGTLELESGTYANLDICPVVFMYRHALELHLKALVQGGGANFLAIKPDPISIGKSHSVSWLAQFVCRLVTAVKWEKQGEDLPRRGGEVVIAHRHRDAEETVAVQFGHGLIQRILRRCDAVCGVRRNGRERRLVRDDSWL